MQTHCDCRDMRYCAPQQKKMSEKYGTRTNVPCAVSQDKLYGYTEEIFHQNKGFDMDALLGNLPASVRADILIYLHPKIIESVPLFEGVTENFVEAMILKLKFLVRAFHSRSSCLCSLSSQGTNCACRLTSTSALGCFFSL